MDDNPWGQPTPPATSLPTPATASPALKPTEAVEAVPSWSEAEPTAEQQQPPAEEEPLEAADEAEPVEGGKKKKNKKKKKKAGAAKAEAEAETESKDDERDEAPAEDEPTESQPQQPPVADADEPEAEAAPVEVVEVPAAVEAEPAPAPEVEAIAAPVEAPVAPSESAPPMDDFPEDDDFGDDDFGEMGGEGGDDDFGDFGDFDAGDAGDADFGEAASFEPTPPQPQPVPQQPVASTSGLPPLKLDWSRPTRKALGPALESWVNEMNPFAKDSMTDEPERQVDGVGQVLVNETLRGLLSTVSSLPPLRPLDWRRSKVRREHLIALGVPVNLDDSAALPPLASLIIDPAPRAATPTLRISTSSAPNSAGPGPFSPSVSTTPQPSRSSTPQGLDRYLPHSPAPPPLDKARAEALCAIGEDDLTLMSVAKLRAMVEEIDRLSVDASGVLTHALLLREKEVGDGETYHGMIQDLVSAAAKMKTTTKGGPPSRQSSGSRWGSKVR